MKVSITDNKKNSLKNFVENSALLRRKEVKTPGNKRDFHAKNSQINPALIRLGKGVRGDRA